MSATELDAAGVWDPQLRRSYLRCRSLNAQHGRTYFLATRLLAPAQRPAVHALYGFARWADDIVDHPPGNGTARSAPERLEQLGTQLFRGLRSGDSEHPVLAAVVDTARRYRLDTELFSDFLRSMRMDLTVRDYPDRTALDDYVRGSAEVIGLQLLPVLGTVGSPARAAPHAATLGKAFQLTNFLRDVAEDLDRGRVYLPADELAVHGVDRELLEWCKRRERTEPRVRAALAEQYAITTESYRYARRGIAMLDPVSRPCIATAATLYGGILDEIEASGFAVFSRRARVGAVRRGRVAATGLARALWARRGGRANRTAEATAREV
ncbi:phytoene/squalene synthase family protein [Bounagaea algeriensis]